MQPRLSPWTWPDSFSRLNPTHQQICGWLISTAARSSPQDPNCLPHTHIRSCPSQIPRPSLHGSKARQSENSTHATVVSAPLHTQSHTHRHMACADLIVACAHPRTGGRRDVMIAQALISEAAEGNPNPNAAETFGSRTRWRGAGAEGMEGWEGAKKVRADGQSTCCISKPRWMSTFSFSGWWLLTYPI